MLPIGTQEETGRAVPYTEVRRKAQLLESSGLDTAWIPDHFIFRFPEQPQSGIWEAPTIMTGLAEATERIGIGSMVICTAFRNPAVLAKIAVTLDEISNGRLILGLGAGWHEPEFTAFGLPFDHLADRFEEALKVAVPLVRGESVDFTGKYVSAPNCVMDPLPSRKIPVLIASRRPRMLRLTAQWADQWNTAWIGHAEALTERTDALKAACDEVGRDYSTIDITVGVNIGFGDLTELSENASDRTKFVTGSVEEIADALHAYADAGVAEVVAWLHPNTEETINRLAEAAKLARS